MTIDEAKRKLDFMKKSYQKLIDEKVDSGKLVGDGVRGEWKAETPLDEAYKSMIDALEIAIKALEQEHCEDVCERFEQSVDIVTDIVEFRFSDGTVKRAKRGLYMRDIEKSIRKMLIDQMANEKKKEPCGDCISREAVIKTITEWLFSKEFHYTNATEYLRKRLDELPPVTLQPKMGRWIMSDDGLYRPICNNCGGHPWKGYIPTVEEATEVFKYCPNCGYAMQEVEG